VLAFPLTDVVVRDPDPAILVGSGDHALDQASVLLFDVRPARDLGLRLAHAHYQRVADTLEVGGAQHARPANGADAPLDSPAWEGGRPQFAELALEACDLAAELIADDALVVGSRRELELVVCE
jgi:hypothetical protein